MHPPKVHLIQAPTPLHRLERASDALGIDLWIKRDDLTGFAMGGNKGRKLEYLIAEAVAQGADVVTTCGAAQSNFIRQLGAACRCFGLTCSAAVMELPFEHEPAVPVLSRDGGNVLLDRLVGVDLRFFPDGTWEQLYRHAEDLALELEAAGRKVYRIPIGGSSALGAFAFYHAANEVKAQAAPFDWIITASSSGSTQVGLTHGFRNAQTRVLGILSDPEPEIVDDFAMLSSSLASLLGDEAPILATDFHVDTSFVGPGYGIPSDGSREAIRWLAQNEGIFLDPIYSGKAFAGLIVHARANTLNGRVLFWHTGGVPALFAEKRDAGLAQ